MVEICTRCGLREVEPTAQEGFCAECIIERIREAYGDKQRRVTIGRREAWSERSQQSWQRDRQRVSRLRRRIRPREPASHEDPWELADTAPQELTKLRTVRMRAEHHDALDGIAEVVRRLAWGPDDDINEPKREISDEHRARMIEGARRARERTGTKSGTIPTAQGGESDETAGIRWALQGSNLRPSPCKGDALPAELSARSRGCHVSARSAHHVAELHRQARRTAGGAPIESVGPARLALALGTDQHLPPARDRPRPRNGPLVRVVGEATAPPTSRSIARLVGSVERTHGSQGYAAAPGLDCRVHDDRGAR